MCPAPVRFSYRPGLAQNPFRNVRLGGSWDAAGRSAIDWSFTPMRATIDDDGCAAFEAEIDFDDSAIGTVFRWGVKLDGPLGTDLWGIASEIDDIASAARERSFTLRAGMQTEIYYLTHCGRFGALPQPGSSGCRFSLWAPNARAVELVLADPAHGYVADDGTGCCKGWR
jgi:1,4-alpha-glucan branching enzyme